jgi:hypothetical protein
LTARPATWYKNFKAVVFVLYSVFAKCDIVIAAVFRSHAMPLRAEPNAFVSEISGRVPYRLASFFSFVVRFGRHK